jgi:hypothetical protein
VTAGAGIAGPHRVVPGATALGDLWVAVTRAGGAVGFTPDALERDIRAKAEAAIADVEAGRAHPLVLGEAADLGGAVDLARAPSAWSNCCSRPAAASGCPSST